MTATLPKLFIGSSKEAQDAGLLEALQEALESALNVPDRTIDLVPWPSSPWGNMTVAVQTLVENLSEYSYGVFILSADDELTLRGTNQYTVRDNVIFEFGLFLGHLGAERTFLVGPQDPNNAISMADVKSGVPAPKRLPLRILTDLGTAYRKGSYRFAPKKKRHVEFLIDDVVASIQAHETHTSRLSQQEAQQVLIHQVLPAARAQIGNPGKVEAFYSSQFFSRFRDIATLKARATARSVQNAVLDLLLYLERIPDLCDVAQLAQEQHHSNDIKEVWVFADQPLEFRAGAPMDAGSKSLRTTITENLKNGVTYVYFVGPDFRKDDLDHLVTARDPAREQMMKNIQVVQVHAQFFSTYFTLHFGEQKGPKSIYMSSVMHDRKDLLIQVSDPEHVRRIYERIGVLRGELEHADSPRITRYVLR